MQNSSLFLIQFILSICTGLLLLRIMLQWFRADFFNPISQFIYRATQPAVRWPAAVLPNWRLNIAALLVAYLVQVLLLWATAEIMATEGSITNWNKIFFSAIFALAIEWTFIIFWCLFGYALLSWAGSDIYQQPIGKLLTKICWPLVAPVDKRVPTVGNFSISIFLTAAFFLLLKFVLTDVHIMLVADLFHG